MTNTRSRLNKGTDWEKKKKKRVSYRWVILSQALEGKHQSELFLSTQGPMEIDVYTHVGMFVSSLICTDIHITLHTNWGKHMTQKKPATKRIKCTFRHRSAAWQSFKQRHIHKEGHMK
jgi:hypothetical protein